MSISPLVSVVIPVYRTERYLKKCIDSVVLQTYKNLEIIIVDDGSPDNAYLIAEKYMKKDKRIRLIRQKNIGLSGARNTGINNITGEYLLFLDSDDTLLKCAINGLLEIAIKEKADMVIPICYYKVFENTGEKKLCYNFDNNCHIKNPTKFTLDVIIEKGRAWRAHSLLYRTEVIKRNNVVFPVGFTAEDIVFNLKFLQFASSISFYNGPTVFYLKRPGSITTSFDKHFFSTILFIDDKVNEFIIKTNNVTKVNMAKKNALLCRNIVVYLTEIMSHANNMVYAEKFKLADAILKNKRVKSAFDTKVVLPYFQNKIIICYFAYIYYLLRNRWYLFAKVSVIFASFFKVR